MGDCWDICTWEEFGFEDGLQGKDGLIINLNLWTLLILHVHYIIINNHYSLYASKPLKLHHHHSPTLPPITELLAVLPPKIQQLDKLTLPK